MVMNEKQKQKLEEQKQLIKTEITNLSRSYGIDELQKKCLHNTIQFYKSEYKNLALQNDVVLQKLTAQDGSEIKKLLEELKEKDTLINELKLRIAMSEEKIENRESNVQITDEIKTKIEEILNGRQEFKEIKNKFIEAEKLKMEVEAAYAFKKIDEESNLFRDENPVMQEVKRLKKIVEGSAVDSASYKEQVDNFTKLLLYKQDRNFENLRRENEKLNQENENLFEKKIVLEREVIINYQHNEILKENMNKMEERIRKIIEVKSKILKINDETFYVEIENLAKEYDAIMVELNKAIKNKEKIEKDVLDLKSEIKRKDGLNESLKTTIENMKSKIEEFQSNETSIENKFFDFSKLVKDYEDRKRAANIHKNNFMEAQYENSMLKEKNKAAETKFLFCKKEMEQMAVKLADCNFQIELLKEDVSNLHSILNCFLEGKQCESLSDVDKYRKLLKCNVCDKRYKNAVINTCMHVFCTECLEMRIKLRNRTCPFCGEPFSINDIKKIYL